MVCEVYIFKKYNVVVSRAANNLATKPARLGVGFTEWLEDCLGRSFVFAIMVSSFAYEHSKRVKQRFDPQLKVFDR